MTISPKLCRGLAAALLAVTGLARADLLVRTDNTILDGKVLSQDAKEVVLQPDGSAATTPAFHADRSLLSRVLLTDDHGALLSETPGSANMPIKPVYAWTVPPEPVAPPVTTARTLRPSYYIIPLHGEVGVTVVAGALEKSLADAALRHPMIVILDINSPGGLVSESEKIIKVLHQYNKSLHIVALVEQDLSAAAIFSLSIKEIYIKPTGTIGAARAFAPNNLFLPPKIEEKMESAWRAVARNSADEGGHTPLLGDAMIDTTLDLHVELIDGKKIIKSGPGARMVVKKGQMLTLSSREAVDCGLAVNQAESIPDLIKVLNLFNAVECMGIGQPLADCLAKRLEMFQGELKKLGDQLVKDFRDAQNADPAGGADIRTLTFRPAGVAPAPAPAAPARGATTPGFSSAEKAQWKDHSLACVLALQKSEQVFQDAIALAQAFGQDSVVDTSKAALVEVSALRAKVFDDRNKYGNHLPPVAPATMTVIDAEKLLAAKDPAQQAKAAAFFAAAKIDPTEQQHVIDLLKPFMSETDPKKKLPFVKALCQWAGKSEVPLLVTILETPRDDQAWFAALPALLRIDAATAEKIVTERKGEPQFRNIATSVLDPISKGASAEKDAAKKLLAILK